MHDHEWGCAKHARLGKTCCQTSEVLVTSGDKVRIRDFTGSEDFWRDTWPADPGYADDGSDPGWTLAFHVDGSRPTLKRRENGDCTFLGEAGCVLPLEVRPIVCRLYPFLYDENGLSKVFSDRCPPEVVPPGSSIVEVLEMDPGAAERWRAQLYAEIRANPGRGR
jgi:Fe-S-cluster containining protein